MTNATIVNSTARIPAVAVAVNVEDGLSTVSLAHGELVLTFADQTTATLSTRDLSPEILSQALLHGLKQKLVDAAAIARNVDTGASATTADKKEAVMEIHARLLEGAWNKGRAAGDGSNGKGSILLLALQRLQPNRDAAELAEWLKARTDAERAALAKNAKILPHVQAIQAERAERAAAAAKKSGVDSDELLNDLLG